MIVQSRNREPARTAANRNRFPFLLSSTAVDHHRVTAVLKWSSVLLAMGLAAYLLFIGIIGERTVRRMGQVSGTTYTPKPDALPGVVVFAGAAWALATDRPWWSWALVIGGMVFIGAHLLSFGSSLVPFSLLLLILCALHAMVARGGHVGNRA